MRKYRIFAAQTIYWDEVITLSNDELLEIMDHHDCEFADLDDSLIFEWIQETDKVDTSLNAAVDGTNIMWDRIRLEEDDDSVPTATYCEDGTAKDCTGIRTTVIFETPPDEDPLHVCENCAKIYAPKK